MKAQFNELMPEVEALHDAEGLPVHIWIMPGLRWEISTLPEAHGRPSDFIYDGEIFPNRQSQTMQ